MTAPICPHCKATAVLTDGREIYPHRRDLHHKPFWKCRRCDAYVGCHPGTSRPLGTPADAALRRARMELHNKLIDPLWRDADRTGGYEPEDMQARRRIRRVARSRVYEFLADKLGLSRDETHTGLFDLQTCRRAWRALQGVAYPDIRAWARSNRQSSNQGDEHGTA